MREYKHIILLVLIMAGVALVVGATSIGVLFGTAMEQQRNRLEETAQSQARLMEAVARFDREYSTYPGGPREATIRQIKDANERFQLKGIGETGEFTLAYRDDDTIAFLLAHKHVTGDQPTSVPFASKLAEPMRRALSGRSGTVVGSDYDGRTVLAAYEPVAELDLGIVAKIDIEEVQSPFFRAGWIVFAVAAVVIASGTVLFFKASEPMIRGIRESEVRYREMFENMASGAAVYEAVGGGSDFVFRDFNRAGEKSEHIDRDQLIGKRLTETFPGVREFGLLDVLKRVWDSGDPEHLPVRLYQDDRIEGWRENYVYRLPSGEVVALFDDVSESKRAEQALRDSEVRMRALLDASQDEIWLVSTEGQVLAINSVARARFAPRRRTADMVGADLRDLLSEQDAETWIAMAMRVAETGERVHIEEEAQGRWFESWIYPVVHPEGPVAEVAVYTRDITDRREAEANLRTLYQATEQSPVSVVITDPDGTIEYVNPQFCRATGYGAAEAVGQNPRILKSGDTEPDEYEALWRTITAGRTWTGEFHNRRKDGELFWESASIAPVKDADGRITHFVGVKEDITLRKGIEEQLRQSQKMEAVGQLTGGIAHDFNNLLAIIIGNLQLLQERAGDDGSTDELMADALWSAQRGADLTHRLLAFARRQPLSPDVIDLNAVVESMIELLRRTIGVTIDIRERPAEDLWTALADRGELERVLVNLAVNARDAMPEGGALTLETENVVLGEDDAGRYADVQPGEYAVLSVTDTGVGMPPDVVARVFEPFFTTKEVGSGSGLGLSMVYGFAKQSGGHVSIESHVGQGTTVRLYLPRARGAAAEQTRAKPRVSTDGFAGLTVLVVEDEAKLHRIAVTMLARLGFKVAVAATAREALDYLETAPAPVDLLFTDIELPGGMDGIALAEEARHRVPALAVVFTSGYSPDAIPGDRRLDPRRVFLPKPYVEQDLARALKAALG